MKRALAVVLFSWALLLFYLYIGALLLNYLRIRLVSYISVGDIVAVGLMLLYGYGVYYVGKETAQSSCKPKGR
ncbi:hypothetical protein [Thermoproteus tenax]|uniref:Uncharacterized protein n=1 Tax=Thermoproteus tenax (strain ATCC 35583 / DSM 2078 / JCM 9277 / NBRC 100435 / Kra 1) TaxID=768679 RepID=G4RP85_THETK|nr:hypothetical protein [Thermoproteus tenax]CCC81380.1 conserved hypothetical protein [Thermoproteus tenax Kra 1]